MSEKKTAYLGTPGYVPDPARYDNENLLKAVGANTGNLMFQHAATMIVGGHREHVGFSGKPYGDPTVYRGLDYFVFPAANHLRADGDWTLLTGFLKTIRVPLVVLGLGAQADRDADPAGTAARVRENGSVMGFVELLRQKAALITVRGAFTEAVCHELGLRDVLRIGCPSQFINADSSLGADVERRIGRLRDADTPARIALTASAPAENHGWRAELEARLFEWMAASSGLYLQQSCESWYFDGPAGRLASLDADEMEYSRRHIAPDMDEAAFAEALRETFRIHFDVRRWIDDLAATDFAIGTRIHGNMAALAASRPGILIVHDARVTELADEMHIPRIDGAAVIAADDYRQALAAVEFDGAAFDRARGEKAARLVDSFSKLGLPASAHLLGLAAGHGHEEGAARAAAQRG